MKFNIMNTFLTFHFTSCIVIISCVRLVNATLSLDVKETVYENKLNNILIDITNNFVFGQFIHIVMSENYSLNWYWDDLIKKDVFDRWSIVITNSNKKVNNFTARHPDVYVIFFNNYNSLIQVCNTLQNVSESWNPGAKFLLITATTNIHPEPAIDEFVINTFNYLWSRNVIRVSLLVFNKSETTHSLFSSSPYSKLYNTCKQILNFSQIQKIHLLNNEIPLNNISGYQFEPPNSFLGCPLVGHTFPFPPYSIADTSSSNGCRVYNSGIEVQLVKLMGHLYNFSLEILTTPSYGTANEWLYAYPNGSRKGMLEDIMQSKIDLAFAGVIPPSNFYFRLAITNAYIDSSMSWYVPAAELIPIWTIVLNTFSLFTWLFMLTMFFVVTMVHYLISGFERNKNEDPVGLTMVALSLGLSIRWTKRPRLRIILLAWSLFCFHVSLMFNTRLFSVLTEPPLDSQIETIQQLQDSGLQTCTFSSYKLFYSSRTDGLMRYLIAKSQNCDSLDESVKMLSKYKNLSILAKDDLMAFKIDNKIDKIHRLKHNKFINYPVVMPVAKGSVFLGILNRLIYNVTESGLVFKWLKDVRQQLNNTLFSSKLQHTNSDSYMMITKQDLVWLYFVLFGGYAISFIVFLIELYFKIK